MKTPLIDIRPDHWAIVRDILQKHVPQYDVWAFGSRAKWTAKQYSDLDLAVISAQPLSLSVAAALADEFSESDLPFKVDAVDWATTSASFRGIIERDKVLMQKTSTANVANGGRVRASVTRRASGEMNESAGLRNKAANPTYGASARDWKEVTLGDVLTFQRGFDLPAQNRKPGKIPIVSSSGITDYHSEVGVAGPGVVTGRYGTIGQVFLIKEDYWPLNTTLWVRDFHGNDPRFTSYLLRTIDFRSCSDKSSVPGVNRNDLHRLPVALPSVLEQRAIAHILGTLDDKIELNRRMNETLEAMARALFKSWFVNFDPVRAKTEGRDPGLSKPLADLFPDSFEDSALGEIPKGWKMGTLADFASLNPESWSKETRPEAISYVDLSNTKWGRIEAITPYAQKDAPSRAQRVLRPGDTIVGTVRPGNGSYAFVASEGLTGSTGFAVLRPRRPEYAPFVYLRATATENIETLSHLADGGAYPAVRPEVVGSTPAIRPDDKVLARFSMLCAPLLAKLAQNDRESSTLAALRDTLLPKLVSGELRVKDTSRFSVTAA